MKGPTPLLRDSPLHWTGARVSIVSRLGRKSGRPVDFGLRVEDRGVTRWVGFSHTLVLGAGSQPDFWEAGRVEGRRL